MCGWMRSQLFAPVKPCRLWAFVLCFIEERELCGMSAGSFIIQTDLINPAHCQSECLKHCWRSLTTVPHSCCRGLLSSWPCTPEPALFPKAPAASAGRDQLLMDSDSEGSPAAAERIKSADQLLGTESALHSLSDLLWVNKDSSVNSWESEPPGWVYVTCGNELQICSHAWKQITLHAYSKQWEHRGREMIW